MKNKLVALTTFIYLLFIIGTIITLWIVYKNVEYSWTYPFVIGYLILLFSVSIYLFFTSVSNMRKMKRVEVRKRIKTFTGLFLSFLTINVLLTFFTKGKVDVLSEISIPLGLALGVAFVPKGKD
jgi:MFS family permease